MKSKTWALLIYRTAAGEPAPADAERAMAGHRALQAETAARGELRASARLGDPATAKTVAFRGGAHEVSDGPYIETKEWLVGFYLIDCASEAEAVGRARKICPVGDHSIEVRPVAWRWEP